MNRLEIGMVVKTSYGTGPYRIDAIHRKCTCCIDFIDDVDSLPEHVHLECSYAGTDRNQDGGDYGLGFYDEQTLRSVRSDDYLEIVPSDEPIQGTLF